MKKRIIAVVGRSGAGKDSMVRMASKELGIPVISSFTERPMRPDETNGVEHIFLTKEEMDEKVKNSNDLFAYTKIGETGYRYCITKSYLESLPGDLVFYIIDPDGIQYLKQNSPEYDLSIINIRTNNDIRKTRAVARNGEASAYIKRSVDEKEQFDRFEEDEDNIDYIVYNNGSLQDTFSLFKSIVQGIVTNLEYPNQQKDNDNGERSL